MAVPILIAATLLSGCTFVDDGVPQSAPAPQVQPQAAPPPTEDITITARKRDPADPLGAVNEKSFAATAAVDAAIGGPAALAYKRVVPKPIRSGIRNFFSNLHEPVVFFNFLLQHKFGKAFETLGRFAINSTVGGGGLLDVARRKPFKLRWRPNSFADTLGFYGVKPGPFFYVPLVGPTTLRDLIGGLIDRAIVPVPIRTFRGPAFRLTTGVVRGLDHRAEIDDRIRRLRNTPDNDYDAAREFYLLRRQAEIDHLRGKPVGPDPLDIVAPAPAP